MRLSEKQEKSVVCRQPFVTLFVTQNLTYLYDSLLLIMDLERFTALTMWRVIRILQVLTQALVNQGVTALLIAQIGLSSLPSPANAADSDLAYVNDFAQIIEPAIERKIAEVAEELDRKTEAHVVVVTLPTLGGRDVEDVTKQLMAAWQMSDTDKGKVVMILDAVAEQKIRIEIGAGLDSLISDETSQRVKQQVMLPHLKKGNRSEAYYLAVTELAAAIAFEKGVALYTILGPGFLRNMPAVAIPDQDGGRFEFLTMLAIIFVPAFVLIFWLARKQFSYGKYLVGDTPPVVGGEEQFPDNRWTGLPKNNANSEDAPSSSNSPSQ
jgi:uncharacterized protein